MQYVCRLGTPDGRVIEEVHEAREALGLQGDLESRGYHVFAIKPRLLGRGLSLARLSSRKIKLRDFVIFNRELVALLKAGMPLLQSLDILLERGREGPLSQLLTEVRERVRNGEEMSEAFAAAGDAIPSLYPSSLKAGERSGDMEEVIRRFIRYLELVIEARRKVVSAVVYPVVLLTLSAIMIAVMSLVVIPQFQLFFDAMSIELPLLTRAILAVSLFVRAQVVWIVVGLVAATLLFMRWSRTVSGALVLDRWQLAMPLLGSIMHRFALSQFSRSLSTLLRGGTPLVPSLRVSVAAVGNTWVRHSLRRVETQVSEGRALYETLDESGIFTDVGIDMVKVGESTGALGEMLDDVAGFLDQEAETHLERLLTLVEPIMLVIMGIVIGVLLVAMYLPMFSAWDNL